MRWNFANAVASRIDLTRPEAKLVIESLIKAGPSDPRTHSAAAFLFEKTFDAEDLARSLAEYETAVALSPNNYILWANLGKARSLNGDNEGADAAFKRALDLAPNYYTVQWAYGNLLVRQGKTDEGFGLIAKAAESDAEYAKNGVTIALQIFDGDIRQVRDAFRESEIATATLATILAGQERFEDAVDAWSGISAADKTEKFGKLGETLVTQLIEAKKYRLAARVVADLQQNEADRPVVGHILNGGFENEIKLRGAGMFEWQIAPGTEPQIGLSGSQKRSGERGLFLLFHSFETSQFRTFSQIIPIEPGAEYEFEGFYRSDLETKAEIKIEITDAATNAAIASTGPLPLAGDWATMRVKFRVPPGADGITIRMAREGCVGPTCTVDGKLSFDDFSLKRL